MNIIKIQEDEGEYWHIKGAPVTMYETLCGFCDTPGVPEETNGQPTCPSCISILKYCKKLRLARNK